MSMDKFEKRQKKVGSRLSRASKSTNSRLLKQASNKMNKSEEMDSKLEALESLFFTMMSNLREGDMKPEAALDDFNKGGKAIFKAK